MVGIQHGSHRIQGRGASVACDGGLPSDPLNQAGLVETEENSKAAPNGLTNKSPYKGSVWSRARWYGLARVATTLKPD